MNIYDYGKMAVDLVMPLLSVPASYEARDGGTLTIRVIPNAERDDMQGPRGRMIMQGSTMFHSRIVFLVHADDFGDVVPTSGDTLTVRDERWRVSQAEQEHPAAPLWKLDCQKAAA